MMHFVSNFVMGTPIAENPGFFTGTFLFLPVTALVIYACAKGDFMDGKGLAIALSAGIISHVLLGAAYGVSAVAGPVAVVCLDVFASFGPVILGWLGCRLFRPRVRQLAGLAA